VCVSICVFPGGILLGGYGETAGFRNVLVSPSLDLY
jgi:hypothetical protein